MGREHANRPSGYTSPALVAVVAAVVIVVAGMGLAVLLTSGSGGPASPASTADVSQDGSALPDYVLAAPARVQEAYMFAAERRDVMVWMPCYCGCGGHSGHLSAHNCFVKESSTPTQIEWDPHGAGCDTCVGIALDAKRMTEAGASLQEIRAYIDETYGSIGPGTDTPMPAA